MAEVSLRPAAPDDTGAIAHVHRLARADYYGVPPREDDERETMWAVLLGEPGRTSWIATADDETVGVVSMRRASDALEMTALYVLPGHHRRGIGTRLHDVYTGHLDGLDGVLEVWAGNRRALAFYLRRGWRPTPATRPGPQGLAFVTHRLPAARAEGGQA